MSSLGFVERLESSSVSDEVKDAVSSTEAELEKERALRPFELEFVAPEGAGAVRRLVRA